MKKLIAVLLCLVMMLTMIPTFFASAATVPADPQEVAAQNDTDNTDDLYNMLKGFIELWGGLLKLIVGSDVAQGFLPALKQVLSLVSIKEFFSTIGSIWKEVTA